MRYFCLITFLSYELRETGMSALRCCQRVSAVLNWCSDSVSNFADVFADSRLVNPHKCLMHTHQELEARVGIGRFKRRLRVKITRYYALFKRYHLMSASAPPTNRC